MRIKLGPDKCYKKKKKSIDLCVQEGLRVSP